MSRLEVGTERSLPQVLRRMVVPALFVGALFVVLLWRTPPTESRPNELLLAGPTMGTRYTLKIVADEPLTEENRTALEARVEQALESVDGAMSTWREDSELERFNRHGTEPFEASAELRRVMAQAIEVFGRSNGAFDVTVGPLVDAWGFGSHASDQMPTDQRVSELLASTGTRFLEVDEPAGTVRKQLAELRVDLSALAKGYAVDRVAAAVEAAGFSDFMVEIGGEVVARGENAAGETWRIGIEAPDPSRRALYGAVKLDGKALATSGDYRNFRLMDEGTISHIIDPRSGRPVTHTLGSVSVLAEDCLAADAWATALSVLGPDEGVALARQLGIPALFIFRRGDGTLGETSTGNFDSRRLVDKQ